MESDESLERVYIPVSRNVRNVRFAEFHATKEAMIPWISSLMDELSRQRSIEETESGPREDVEEIIHECISTIPISSARNFLSLLAPHKSYTGMSDGSKLPFSFKQDCSEAKWAKEIGREYKALNHRKTWTYILKSPSSNPIPFKWIFRANQVDEEGIEFLQKARCNLRGELQEPSV